MNIRLSDRHRQTTKHLLAHYRAWPAIALLRGFEVDLLGQMRPDPPTLDLACGDGLITSMTFPAGCFAGCDLMADRLAEAAKRGNYRTLTLADGRALPYAGGVFGSVVSNSSVEHIPRPKALLQEVARVLKPSGAFIFTTPASRFSEWLWLSWLLSRLGLRGAGKRFARGFNRRRLHVTLLDADQWRRMLEEAGFERVELVEYFPLAATLLFSWLETLWGIPFRLPWPGRAGLRSRWVNVPAEILYHLPRFLRVNLVLYLSMWVAGSRSNQAGSHLLVVARKGGLRD